MEWLDGEDLADRLLRSDLSMSDSVAIVVRAAEGLALAHARGVIHRDIKPSNVFLVGSDPFRVKLLDFGIARVMAWGLVPRSRATTRTGTVLGTAGYMSPEQVRAEKDLDARSDVFSLGCVLFECLTGQAAFAGKQAVAVLAKLLREEAPRVRALRPQLPEALDELVTRMLAKERHVRPQDGSAVAIELANLSNPSACR
jgi:serine/threonine protein kinase